MALQQREKDLGDHLKPIMAPLQPPRNSVTDGDLVFIAGVIGNTQTHIPRAHTHNTRMYKEIDTHIRHSLCLYSGIDITHTHRHACTGLTGSRKSVHFLSACLSWSQSDSASVWIKKLCHGKANKAQGWPERHVCVFHGLIRADVYSRSCRQDRGCTSQLSVSACQRVKPACENIYKTHLPLVRRHKWLPCGLLINRPVYLLELNKLATNTDKELKNYKYCDVMKSLNVLQVFYEGATPLPFLCSWRYFFWLLSSFTHRLVK